MNKPLISVVIPIYNTASSAIKLVNSLMNDQYNNLEIILIDDGSTDNSLGLLKPLASSKVHVFTKTNGGPSSARNFGIAKAKGDFLLFIDSDDEVAPDFISKLSSNMKDPSIALVSTGYLYHRLSDNSKKPVSATVFPKKKNESQKSYVLRALLAGRMYAVNNKIFRASVVRDADLRFDESIKFAEDTKFVLDYLTAAEGEIKFIPEPLYIYNYGTETSVSSSPSKEWANWQKSFNYLKTWIGHPSIKDRVLLALLHSRWRVACFRSAQRAKEGTKND